MPLVLGWIWWGVRQGLRPLRSLTDQIASQQPTRLTPLAAGQVPDEIAPLVHALNALLARLDEALDSERRFTADAAHELRTPLAALRVQVEVAQLANGPEARRKALGQVLAGMTAPPGLVSQLLTLWRAWTTIRRRWLAMPSWWRWPVSICWTPATTPPRAMCAANGQTACPSGRIR